MQCCKNQTSTKRSFLWKQTLKRSKEKPKHFDKVALQNRRGSQSQGLGCSPGTAACWWGLGATWRSWKAQRQGDTTSPGASRGFPQRDIKCSLADPRPVPPRPLQRNKKARGPGTTEGRCEGPSLRRWACGHPRWALRHLPWTAGRREGLCL